MSRSTVIMRARRVVSGCGAFLLGDRALLRTGGPGPVARAFGLRAPIYRPHPYTLYELSPDWRSTDGRSRHNSLGFRGAEVSVDKPASRIRIVCMGESTTYCTGIGDDDMTYPARLEAHLRNRRPGLDIEVINAGVGGYTSIENLLHCHFRVVPLAPDLIVSYYTHNDVHPRRMPRLSRDYREYSRSWYEPPFGGGIRGWTARRRNLASGDIGSLVRRYDEYAGQRHSANVLNNPPEAFRANVRALAVVAHAAGAKLLFVSPPYRNPRAPDGINVHVNPAYNAVFEHRSIVEMIGAELGFAVYDLARDMPYPVDPHAFPNEHYLDPVHVSEKGADLMGHLVAEAVLAAGLLRSA
jgi:lysophospholipase L1-like esterase